MQISDLQNVNLGNIVCYGGGGDPIKNYYSIRYVYK